MRYGEKGGTTGIYASPSWTRAVGTHPDDAVRGGTRSSFLDDQHPPSLDAVQLARTGTSPSMPPHPRPPGAHDAVAEGWVATEQFSWGMQHRHLYRAGQHVPQASLRWFFQAVHVSVHANPRAWCPQPRRIQSRKNCARAVYRRCADALPSPSARPSSSNVSGGRVTHLPRFRRGELRCCSRGLCVWVWVCACAVAPKKKILTQDVCLRRTTVWRETEIRGT
jgi:hypothetical protein